MARLGQRGAAGKLGARRMEEVEGKRGEEEGGIGPRAGEVTVWAGDPGPRHGGGGSVRSAPALGRVLAALTGQPGTNGGVGRDATPAPSLQRSSGLLQRGLRAEASLTAAQPHGEAPAARPSLTQGSDSDLGHPAGRAHQTGGISAARPGLRLSRPRLAATHCAGAAPHSFRCACPKPVPLIGPPDWVADSQSRAAG